MENNGKNQVAECAFEFMYAEIVRSILARDEQVCQKNQEPTTAAASSVAMKLEGIGYDVGYRFVERCTVDRPRLIESLDVIKFICKEFWLQLFSKQIDKLQTNHQGTFVLQDLHFRWIRNASSFDDASTNSRSIPFLYFPCGILRGALANLGVAATVNAEVGIQKSPHVNAPACSFNININPSSI